MHHSPTKLPTSVSLENHSIPTLILRSGIVQTCKIIRNGDFPSCVNCVFYRPNVLHNKFNSPLNKCEKIGIKNVVTGEITYNYADLCRSDEELCGKSGKYHVKEPRMALKRLKHVIFRPVAFFYAIAGLIIFSRFL